MGCPWMGSRKRAKYPSCYPCLRLLASQDGTVCSVRKDRCFSKVMFSSLFCLLPSKHTPGLWGWGGIGREQHVLTWPEGLGCGLGTWHTAFTSRPHCEPGPNSQQSSLGQWFQTSVVPVARKFCSRRIGPLEMGIEEPGYSQSLPPMLAAPV